MVKRKKKTKRRRRAAGSKKGTPFEREMCKQLSLWWTNGDREDVFWRTSNSGGRATVRGSLKNQHGDVTATDPIGLPLIENILIEIKRGYTRDTLQDYFDNGRSMKKSQYERWARKCVADCAAADIDTDSWIIIIQRDRREVVMLMPQLRFESFGFNGIDIDNLTLSTLVAELCMVTLDDFFYYASPVNVELRNG